MHYLISLILIISLSFGADFTNNGATITISDGILITVTGSFENESGTVTNSGSFSITGDLGNNGTFNSESSSSITLNGSDQSFFGGSYSDLIIDNAGTKTMLEDVDVVGVLTLNDGTATQLNGYILTVVSNESIVHNGGTILGGGCGGTTEAILYCEDTDGDGDGFGADGPSVYCAEFVEPTVNIFYDVAPEGWVDNCNDAEPNCTTNNTDDCGVCAGGNADMDCSGECNGDAQLDCLGQCNGDAQLDCNSVCNGGAAEDGCGVCAGGGTGLIPNADEQGCGCFEPPLLDYYIDNDSDGLGSGDAVQSCNEIEGWVTNSDDEYPNCTSNQVDCNEECDGTAGSDDCGVCAGGSTGIVPDIDDLGCGCDVAAATLYCIDTDGDGNGAGDPESYCAAMGNTTSNTTGELLPDDWVEDCSDSEPNCPTDDEDCFGMCGGVAQLDCDEICNGSAAVDGCGVCAGGFTGLLPDADEQGCGCFGPPITDYYIDMDGDGLGSGDPWASCNELSGYVTNSDDEFPNCTSNQVDCNEECDGTAEVDGCGDCWGGNTGQEACLSDCNNIDGGSAYLDDCGICVGGLTGLLPDANDVGCGCFVAGVIEYCIDTDGDGNGAGDPESYCAAMGDTTSNTTGDIFPDDWVEDCSDPEPDCQTNDTDECEVCAGNNASDLGCGCDVAAATLYCIDTDGDGNGAAGQETFYCTEMGNATSNTSGEILPDGWVEDCSDSEPNCATDDEDCFGLCGGEAQLDCNSVCNGGADVDICDVCAGGSTGLVPDIDDLGCGCFEPSMIDYYLDIDGDGLGSGGAQPSCNEIEGYVANSDDEYPNCTSNQVDCNDDCDGTAEVDGCGDCWGGNTELDENLADMGCGCGVDSPVEHCEDIDNDNLGDGSINTLMFCLTMGATTDNTVNTLTDTGWVPNCSDPEPDCGTNDTDCNEECAGSAIINACSVCTEGGTELPQFILYSNSNSEIAYLNDEGFNNNGDYGYYVPYGSDCAGVCNGDAIIDYCGVCDGNSVFGMNGQADIDACAECFGENDCIPKLISISPSNVSEDGSQMPLDLRTESISLTFSTPINVTGLSPISIQTDVYGSDFELSTPELSEDKQTIIIPFDTELASYDNFTVFVDANQISSVNEESSPLMDFDANGNNLPDDADQVLEISFITAIIGDYDNNLDIDGNDIQYFVDGWRNSEFEYEAGPFTGSVPHLIPTYDEDYDIDDMMGFIMMYNWAGSSSGLSRSLPVITDQGFSSHLYVENNSLYLDLPISDDKVSSIHLVVQTNDHIIINVSDEIENTFDLVLDRKWENSIEWNFARINIDKDILSLEIGELIYDQMDDTEIIIGYEITNENGDIFSSRTASINYIPIPEQFTMSSAFPNPFNPQTRITYGLHKDSYVSINVYDMRGRLIDKLFSGNREKGYFDMIWDANNFTSGIYFIHFNIDNEINTQKIILLK